METRICSMCNEEKELIENFHKMGVRNGVQRRMYICKECDRQRGNEYAKQTEYYKRPERSLISNKKRNASYQVNMLVRKGSIPKAKSLKCVDCESMAKEYHHEDYDKPFDVVPLCVSCHKKRHKSTVSQLKEDVAELRLLLSKTRSEMVKMGNVLNWDIHDFGFPPPYMFPVSYVDAIKEIDSFLYGE